MGRFREALADFTEVTTRCADEHRGWYLTACLRLLARDAQLLTNYPTKRRQLLFEQKEFQVGRRQPNLRDSLSAIGCPNIEPRCSSRSLASEGSRP